MIENKVSYIKLFLKHILKYRNQIKNILGF